MQALDSTERLGLFRHELQLRKLEAFIIPMEDCHCSEYLADADKRIAFISGFTGSAGTVVITGSGKAALWTDGRYHEQASRELDKNWTLMRDGLPGVPKISTWLAQMTPSSCRIGFDPQQVPFHRISIVQRQLNNDALEVDSNRLLVPVEGTNLVDLIWRDRPSRPANPIRAVSVELFAGQSWNEKLDILRHRMEIQGVTTFVTHQLDEIAWLFNLRGSDIKFNPLFFAYAVITMTDVHFFVDWKRGPSSIDFEDYFRSSSHPVSLYPYAEFPSWLSLKSNLGIGRIWLPLQSNYAIVNEVSERQRLFDFSPLSSLKSVKNTQEIEGMRISNLVDSLALCDFLAWLEDVSQSSEMDPAAVAPCDVPGVEPPTIATEASVAAYLSAIRLAADGCLGLSFAPISGVDANGAIIHYSTDECSGGAQLTPNSLFLIDSGGQYTSGTTDVTRTVCLGIPTKEQVMDYTHVLKAHASLASLTFPENTQGTKLDVVCRASMWRDGRDFAHGTGHGVGANLCVHEGPIGMSARLFADLSSMGNTEPGIRKNMVLTIEPGYYLTGKYGIRLENVVLVRESLQSSRNFAAPFLRFEALTLVPFQRRLIDAALLDKDAVMWVDAYHTVVRERLLDRLAFEARGGALTSARKRTHNWIIRETEPLFVASAPAPPH